jgi:hypothetical protein
MKNYDRIIKIFQSLVIISLGTIGIVQFVITNNLVIYGGEITENDKRVIDIKRENSILIRQIAEESALSSITQKAKLQGFITPTVIVSLSQEYPVAIRP